MECLLTEEETLEGKAKLFLRRESYLRGLTRKMTETSCMGRVGKGLDIAKNLNDCIRPHTDIHSASMSVDHKPIMRAWIELKNSDLLLSELDPF